MRLGPSDRPSGTWSPGRPPPRATHSPVARLRISGFKVKSFVVREELAGLTSCYQSVVAWARRLCLVVTSDGPGQAGVLGERTASGWCGRGRGRDSIMDLVFLACDACSRAGGGDNSGIFSV